MQMCLVVDDAPVIRKIARVILEDMKIEVREAEHGRQAFEMCALEMPDAILLDWQLPVMGAYEFLRALQVFQPRKWPFIFYCTTEIDFVEMQRARAAGAGDVIIKPFDRESLQAKFARFNEVLAIRQMAMMAPDQPWQTDALKHVPGR